MSNRLFQGLVHQMRDTIDATVGVVDDSATIIACSDLTKVGTTNEFVSLDLSDVHDIFIRDGYTYKPFGSPNKPEYAVFVEGVDDAAAKYANILAIALFNVKQYYDEKYDRNNFIKNVVLDNVLPGDIEIKGAVDAKDLEKLARSIADTLSGEFYTRVNVGIGTIVDSIKELSRSFKEAQTALEVGKVFDTDKAIVSYDNLGIARLIYHLPTTLCETFLHEVFKRGSIESLDHETLFTIQKFFENNLNVSETSRKLFVHRNTLVYRLEKIKKLTGLDLREFDHAIIFKIALMVKRYLSANPAKF